ncbi:MAG: M15 family metallopeptidase [Armatimonadota bacterium]
MEKPAAERRKRFTSTSPADYAFTIDGKVTWDGPWDTFGRIAKQCGLEWGGAWKSFKDRPHVQYTGGKTLAQMRAAKNAK